MLLFYLLSYLLLLDLHFFRNDQRSGTGITMMGLDIKGWDEEGRVEAWDKRQTERDCV